MRLDLDDLPGDLDLCHQLVRDLVGTLTKSRDEIDRLRTEVDRLLRRDYGPKRERWTEGQQSLFEDVFREARGDDDGDAGNTGDEGDEGDEGNRRKKRKRKRRPRQIPEHLPRETIQHDLPTDECQCGKCGGTLTLIGYVEGASQIEYVPATFKVLDHKMAKYACKNAGCTGTVVTTPPPPHPVDRCFAGPGLLAHVITSKYADHLPLYRQAKIFGRSGLSFSRSTLCRWAVGSAVAMSSIVTHMAREVRKSFCINSDDVRVPLLSPGNGKTHSAYLWPYLGDEDHPHAVFVYTHTREGAGPADFLSGYRGYLQADAYPAYDALYASGEIVEVGCWAHARRKFYDIRAKHTKLCGQALDFIKSLYAVERGARARHADLVEVEGDRAPPLAEVRRQLRAEHSQPIIDQIRTWLDRHLARLRPESELAKAMAYVHNQWTALTRFLEDGRLLLDNNRAERSLRRVVVGRKNWLFAGSDGGGEAAAIHFSLVASCELHGIDPFAYYRDALSKLHSHAPAELTPAAWAASQRQAEAKAKAEAEAEGNTEQQAERSAS